jgi:hypothetical protein
MALREILPALHGSAFAGLAALPMDAIGGLLPFRFGNMTQAILL